MVNRLVPQVCRVTLFAALSTLTVLTSAAQARDADWVPFAGVAGAWAGDGTIAMADGTRERIRCRAVYRSSTPAAEMSQSLRCASDSYQFDVQSQVRAAPDGALSGTWSEAVHGVSGDVSGRVEGGRIETSVDTLGFSAHLSVATQGRRQTVSIRPDGGEVESVSITMQRI